MPAPLFINLNKEEDSTLYELSVANGVPRRTKLRAMALRLNANGSTVLRIATYLQQSQQTVRQTLQRWQNQGLAGLWEAAGRGKKRCWKQAGIKAVEGWLEEERSYTPRQLSEKLALVQGVEIEAKWLQRLLKKRGGYGSDFKLSSQTKKTRVQASKTSRLVDVAAVGRIGANLPQIC